MIPVPNLSEFTTLSILAFIYNNCLLHCIYLSIVCFALFNSMPELLFAEFQEQVFEEGEDFFSGQKGKGP
jgi:hypothetical protein